MLSYLVEHEIFSANLKMPTMVGIFIFISREILCSAMFSKKNFAIVNNLLVIRDLLGGQISCSAELSMKKVL